MPKIFKIVCLFVLCISIEGIAQTKRHPALDKKISLNSNEQLLKDVLNKISAKTGLYFSYDPTVFDAEKRVTIHYSQQKTEEILKDLFRDEYVFKLLQNQVIITKPFNRLNRKESAEVKNLHFKFSGSVRNKIGDDPIPYASISILGKAIGTITNTDGEYELKLPIRHRKDTLVVSCLGYNQKFIELDTLKSSKLDFVLQPIDIKLKEIQITAIDPIEVIDKMLYNIEDNYPYESNLMTAFYREVLLQDEKYISVSEAILNILKASYESKFREDRIRFLKGRKSHEVDPFKWVDFKMQGGPYYITKLDVIKTMDTFLDPEYRLFYSYEADKITEYHGRMAYVIRFRPILKMDFLSYEGRLFIDKKTHALLHAEFELSRDGKKLARKSLIRKKPKKFHVRPIDLKYEVAYKQTEGKWHLNTAKTSVMFHVRSKRDKINSVFHSISDLLITDHEKTNLKRFDKEESFQSSDIFTEQIKEYDPDFWGQFNVIKPTQDLKKALSGIELQNNFDLDPFSAQEEKRVHKTKLDKNNLQSNKQLRRNKKKNKQSTTNQNLN